MSSSRFLVFLLPVAAALTGCGKNPLISDVNFKTQEVGSKTHLELTAQLGLGLPDMIPIVLPIQRVGTLSVSGKTVSLTINATDALRLRGCVNNTLPNGAALPVSVPSAVRVACIPISGSDSRVYVGFNGKEWMAGVAVAIKINSPVNLPLNIMLPIPMKDPSIQAVGGTFFGQPSGLGVFAVKSTGVSGSGAVSSLAALSGRVPEASVGSFELKPDLMTERRKSALRDAYYETDSEVYVD